MLSPLWCSFKKMLEKHGLAGQLTWVVCHGREQDFAPWLSIRRRRPAWLTSYPVSGDILESIRLCLDWTYIEFSIKNSSNAMVGSPSHWALMWWRWSCRYRPRCISIYRMKTYGLISESSNLQITVYWIASLLLYLTLVRLLCIWQILKSFLCDLNFIVTQLVVEHFVQVYAVGCTMKCHINVLDFTPGPTSECSVDSTWFVIPLDNILLWFFLKYLTHTLCRYLIRNFTMWNIWSAIFTLKGNEWSLQKLISVLLFISHSTPSQAEEKWQKQLQCSEPVVAVASHPLNDWLLAGTQVHILVLKTVLIYGDSNVFWIWLSRSQISILKIFVT